MQPCGAHAAKVSIWWRLTHTRTQVLGRTHLQSVPTHKHIYALQKYSNYVDFIIQIRSFFLSEFAKHQADFPGIDGESLFLGTVVHSTDHGNATHFCKPWDLVGKTVAYKANEEIAGLVSSTFTDRLPLITLACDMRFKHAKHPLFLKTYAVRFPLYHCALCHVCTRSSPAQCWNYMALWCRMSLTRSSAPCRTGRCPHRPPPRRRDGMRHRPLDGCSLPTKDSPLLGL